MGVWASTRPGRPVPDASDASACRHRARAASYGADNSVQDCRDAIPDRRIVVAFQATLEAARGREVGLGHPPGTG